MGYNNDVVATKLVRWKKYLKQYQLPKWEIIPDIGLYMEQVIDLLKHYLDYLPPELKEEQFITASTINNYVRTRVMPQPDKKKYYRVQIAYLIIILTLKQSLSLAMIQRLIPMGLTEKEVEARYTEYVERHSVIANVFCGLVEKAAAPITRNEVVNDSSVETTEELIEMSAVMGGFTRVLAEKLLLLENKTMDDIKNDDKF